MKTLRLVPTLLTITIVGALACVLDANAAADAKTRVLIVTGDDVGVHDWLACSSQAREYLEQSGRCEVSAVGNPAIFEDAKHLESVDVIYFAMCDVRTPTLRDRGRANLLAFVKGGGGFVAVHYAAAAFKDWPEFRDLTGRVWVTKVSGHGPRGVFKSQIVDHDHYITAGLKDFETDDELYAKLQGDAPIHVLVEAYSDWSKDIEPMAFTRRYGDGRVFYCAFGHDVRAMLNPPVRQLLVQGTLWAAGHDE